MQPLVSSTIQVSEWITPGGGLVGRLHRGEGGDVFYTDIEAPWAVVKSNDKKGARLEAMRFVLTRFDYPDKDLAAVGTPDPLMVGPVRGTTRPVRSAPRSSAPPVLPCVPGLPTPVTA
ncbi:hypothetical protein ABZV93_28340 [Actinopolymorpha sp. NPDC004070]|uniref:hypothetical protein n=1 Tax=Actinopolymorpha sp. NPDC004070 TaxID=3154548 RepID=UPI0033AC7316